VETTLQCVLSSIWQWFSFQVAAVIDDKYHGLGDLCLMGYGDVITLNQIPTFHH
jgi:hypothetical protein